MARILEIEQLPIRLTERGSWLHGETPLHPRVAALFARHLVPEADGRYFIVLGRDRQPVAVADAAYFVETIWVEADPEGGIRAIRLTLSDGATETLDPSTLMISGENVLYARVVRHGLSVPCRFPSSLYHRIALHIEEAPGGGYVLPVAGRDHPLAPYDRRPVPAS
jgi:hypothetical protein